MISHESMKASMRAYAKTLSVCTTGVISMSATTLGYVRVAGSFLDDGFAVGLELVAAGFAKAANNGVRVVSEISSDGKRLSVDEGTVADAVAGGRTLSVGFPSRNSWENVAFTPAPGKPYTDEQYIPGAPPAQVTLGPLGEIELTPMYSIHFNVRAGTGELAAQRYGDAFSRLFAPRTAIALGNNDVLRVRSDTGPYPGQLLPGSKPGFEVLPVTIPFRLRTFNSI